MTGSVQRIGVGVGVAFACTAIPPTEPLLAPKNDCPEHACSAYVQLVAPQCVGGACVTAATMPIPSDFVLVVAVPQEAFLAPGRSYAQRLSELDASAPLGMAPTVHLHAPATIFGFYEVEPHVATDNLHWELGNAGQTLLPVQVTYRALWAKQSTSVDAVDVGLPLYPVFADQVEEKFSLAPGPANGPAITFSTFLVPGTYEQTIAPQPPFDRAFPPDVSVITIADTTKVQTSLQPDTTQYIEPRPIIPQFEISRPEGLDGWTAYLRDARTKRAISPTQSLSGTSTTDGGVLLPTSHHPNDGDALSNAELVIAPPPGSPYPTYSVAARGKTFAKKVVYPELPPLATVRGTVSAADGTPVSAEVFFEALTIYDRLLQSPLTGGGADAGEAGAEDGGGIVSFVPNDTNFSLITRTTTRPDSTGASVYSIALPPGTYRRVVRPLDAPVGSAPADAGSLGGPGDGGVLDAGDASPYAMLSGVLVIDWLVAPPKDDVHLDSLSRLRGKALTTDGRSLAGATVVAIPRQCPMLTDTHGANVPGDSAVCRPRAPLSAITNADGLFALELDPGTYVLRVEPAFGTRLPWVTRSLIVPMASPVLFEIPAPVYRGMILSDIAGNPIGNAMVRMFVVPDDGLATEIGRAFTDANGRFDMYLDPSVQ